MQENIIDNFINNLVQDRNLLGKSTRWANWMSMLTIFTCKHCVENHGKIFEISILDGKDECDVNAHDRCKCKFVAMRTKLIGTATNMWYNGADAQLFFNNKLPDYYISKTEARHLGWQGWKGNLDEVLPGKMIGGDVYKNIEGKLPENSYRIWYEADFDYINGFRNEKRILYSNDGLIFGSYDHAQTFYETTEKGDT